MITRYATHGDIANIVTLLKASLGEVLLEKSEAYWRWKHIQNPFGESPVLLSIDGDKIVGVRAFMHWQWRSNKGIIKSIRAVDTATHPGYQGKGIFKKLTLSLLEDCRKGGLDMVFNTPNSNSKPGYLKMGWKEAGKLPVDISIKKPFRMVMSRISSTLDLNDEIKGNEINEILEAPAFSTLIGQINSEKVITNYSLAYFRWRYVEVPNVKYGADLIHDAGKSGVIFYRVKPGKFGRELRITDSITHPSLSMRKMGDLISATAKRNRADYVTISNFTTNRLSGMINARGLKIGPTVTIRELNMNDLSAFTAFAHWTPSLGDLELF